MSTVEEIELAIDKLPRDQFFRLHSLFQEKFDDEWDHQIEEDVNAGRLDYLGEEAIKEYQEGRTTPFPENE